MKPLRALRRSCFYADLAEDMEMMRSRTVQVRGRASFERDEKIGRRRARVG